MPFDKSNAGGSSSFAEGAQQLVNVSFQFLFVHSIPCASWIFQPNNTMLWTYSLFKFINFVCFVIKKHSWYHFQICQFWLFFDKKSLGIYSLKDPKKSLEDQSVRRKILQDPWPSLAEWTDHGSSSRDFFLGLRPEIYLYQKNSGSWFQ